MSLWWKQILAVARLELRKTFFARRGLWIYFLALAPVALFTAHAVFDSRSSQTEEIQDNRSALTQQDAEGLQTGMTREQIIAKLGEPRFARTRSHRTFNDEGERITVKQETLRYFGRDFDLTLVLEDGKLTGTLSNARRTYAQDNYIFAGVFQFFFIRLAVFFGCLGIFMNLFRGEMIDKSIHYYLLAPIRREILLVGKFLAGLVAATVIFTASVALQLIATFSVFPGNALSNYLYQEHGLAHVGAYLGVTVLACIGYGSVFLAAGLLYRNPIFPAAVILIWEAANPLLPALLKKFSVIYYLKSLCPVQIPLDPGMPSLLAMLVSNGDPISAYVAVLGLLVLAAVVLWASAFKVRSLEINYTTE